MTGHCVYKLYASDGEPLYIGVTSDLHRRMREHRRQALWWGWVARSVIVRYPSRQAAELAEAAAIASEGPAFNVKVPRSALRQAA